MASSTRTFPHPGAEWTCLRCDAPFPGVGARAAVMIVQPGGTRFCVWWLCGACAEQLAEWIRSPGVEIGGPMATQQ